ncbi:MAG: efflux RND transporter periplasmic adaptor subunit [bacterium]
MRTNPSPLRLSAAVLSLFVIASACSKAPPARARSAVPVVATRAKLADVPYTIDANGVVVPLRSANVGSQVEGIIKRVAFTEGQNVVAGQTLFEIDPRPYRGTYQQAVAVLARDKVNADNATREADRYAALAAQDYVTKEQAEQQRANAGATSATVAADEAAVANAKFNLDNTTIRAPISGRTGAVLVKEGNLVHANGTAPLVVINQVSPILVRFAIPATQLPLLQKYGSAGGLAVRATPNSGSDQAVDPGAPAAGLNIGRSDPGVAGQGGPPGSGDPSAAQSPSGTHPSPQLTSLVQAEHGTLSFIDNAVDTTTGTVLLKASFPNANQRLWTGEFVSAQLSLFVEQQALVVPSQAVVTGQNGAYVYVITDSSTAQQRPVQIERTAGTMSIIASGLRNGDQIVTEGQSRLTPNAKVSIMTPQGGAGSGRGAGGRGGRGSGGADAAGAAQGTAPAATADSSAAGNPGGARGGRARRGGGAPSTAPTPK